MTPLRVLIAEEHEEDRHLLVKHLGLLGHRVVGVAETGRQLADLCRTAGPDVVIAGADGLEAAHECQVPFILVAPDYDDQLLKRAGGAYVFSYLVKPVTGDQLKAALDLARRLFEQVQSLKQRLEDRKLVERAKGAVMRRLGVGEEDAFRRLKKMARDENRKLVEVAREVLEAEGVFRKFDRLG